MLPAWVCCHAGSRDGGKSSSRIWVKVHPDVLEGKKTGYFADCAPRNEYVWLPRMSARSRCWTRFPGLRRDIPIRLWSLAGRKPVTCFGQPWYAGWGLTDDAIRSPLCYLPDAVLPRWKNFCRCIPALLSLYRPAHGGRKHLFTVLQWLQLQRNHQQQRNAIYGRQA